MTDQFQQAELIQGQFYVSRTDSNEPTQQSFATLSQQVAGGPFANEDDANDWVSQQTEQPTRFQVWQHTAEFATQA